MDDVCVAHKIRPTQKGQEGPKGTILDGEARWLLKTCSTSHQIAPWIILYDNPSRP